MPPNPNAASARRGLPHEPGHVAGVAGPASATRRVGPGRGQARLGHRPVAVGEQSDYQFRLSRPEPGGYLGRQSAPLAPARSGVGRAGACGPATYYLPAERLGFPPPRPKKIFSPGGLSTQSEGLSTQSEGLSTQPEGLSHKFEVLSHKSEGLSHKSEADATYDGHREQLLAELPRNIREALESLGQRSRDPRQLSELIRALCAFRPYGARDLAVLLMRRRNYLRRRHIVPLFEQGEIQYLYPNEPNRPDQAYITTREQE